MGRPRRRPYRRNHRKGLNQTVGGGREQHRKVKFVLVTRQALRKSL
jgi:hypothetical protein